jgi:hypothetical protein
MPVIPSTPTESIHVGRPYTPPAAWHQTGHPCNCGCPECTRWTIFISPLTLVVGDKDACYTGNLPVVMPLLNAVTEPWCVSLKGNTGTLAAYAAERMFEGAQPEFIIDGVAWEYFYLSAGEQACVCYRDGFWYVTGDAHGSNEQLG